MQAAAAEGSVVEAAMTEAAAAVAMAVMKEMEAEAMEAALLTEVAVTSMAERLLLRPGGLFEHRPPRASRGNTGVLVSPKARCRLPETASRPWGAPLDASPPPSRKRAGKTGKLNEKLSNAAHTRVRGARTCERVVAAAWRRPIACASSCAAA